MNEVNRAVILAAGLGTRLKWLTSDRPKAMMAIYDEPAIVHVIRALAGQGIHDIVINVHHHAEKLIDFLDDGSKFGVRLYYSREKELLDSGGGVRKAMDLLPGHGLVAVHNADVMADIDLQALANRVPPAGGALALVANPIYHSGGDFGLEAGMITDHAYPKYTYSGVSVWDAKSFADLCSGDVFSLTKPMRQLMEKNKLHGLLHQGMWFDIGRPRDLMQARLAASFE